MAAAAPESRMPATPGPGSRWPACQWASAAAAGLRLPAEPAAGKVTQVRKERPRRCAASQRAPDAVRLPVLAAPGPAREGCVDAAAGAAGVQARLG